jgi:hypothetical protein
MSGRLAIPPFDGQSSMRRPDHHSENNDLLKIAHVADIVRLNTGACRFHPLLISRMADGATRSSDQSYEVMINLIQTRPQN